MSITIYTKHPEGLLSSIKEKIAENKIMTWELRDNVFFAYVPPQWKNKAWMKCVDIKKEESITFGIIKPKGKNISKETYSIYHTRFAEILLTHFDTIINSVSISALGTSFDII